MKKKIAALIVLCLLAAVFTCASAFAETVYVSTTVDMAIGNEIVKTVPQISTSEHITLASWKWYHSVNGDRNNTSQPVSDGETFEQNTQYLLCFEIKADAGYRVSNTLNGITNPDGYGGQPKDSDTFTAKYLLTPAPTAEKFDATVKTPVIGDNPAKPTANSSPTIYSVKDYTWYVTDDNGKTAMTEDQKFEKDKSYSLKITFETNAQNLAVGNSTGAKLNDTITATTAKKLSYTTLESEFDFGVITTTRIKSLDIAINEPVVGDKLDYNPTVITDPADSVEYSVNWSVTENSTSRYEQITDKDKTVVKDRYYCFTITITPKDGYVINADAIADDDYYWWWNENDDGSITLWHEFATYAPYEITFTKKVELGGTAAPVGEHTFKFETNINSSPFTTVTKITAEATTTGKGTFEGKIKLYGDADSVESALKNGIFISETPGNEAGWTYDDSMFYIIKTENEKTGSSEFVIVHVLFDEEGKMYPGEQTDKVEFVNIYTSNEQSADEASAASSGSGAPATDDSSNCVLWAVLAIISAGALFAHASRKKRSR